ncbi:MAG TPA: FtsX-like permease family protein [Puia sp.]|nr:FtsX-like permease family protein [Puia sp.]
MLKNYFTIARRHLFRHKLFSLINIFCIAIGITFSMIIGVYILRQEGVNGEIRDLSNQYIVKSNWKVKEMGLDITTLGPLPKTMKDEYPALVANYYRFNPVATVVSVGVNRFKENIAICDTTLVSMYGFPVLFGDKQKAFTNINSAVITESVAEQLFGLKNAVGKSFDMLTTSNGVSQSYQISAVLKDIPQNSVTGLMDTMFNVFVPTIGNNYYGGGDPSQGWTSIFEAGRIELMPGVTPQQMVQPFRQTLAKYTKKVFRDNLEVQLTPVKDYYLKKNDGAVQKMIVALSFIAAFILLMAIINFVNINIATSSYRLKEIGLRKVFGSLKTQLIIQFITEALVLALIAASFSVVFYELLRNLFAGVLGTELVSVAQFGLVKILLLFILVLLIGLISGIYPAFVLSSLNTTHAVRGKIDSSKGGSALRKTLLVVQFSLAIVVFVSAIVVSRQMAYIFTKDLGYNKEQLLIVDALPKRWDAIGIQRMKNVKAQLMRMPEVRSASLSFEIPTRKPVGQVAVFPPGNANGSPVVLATFSADQDYGSTFGLQLVAGTFFNQSGSFIPNQIVLNESSVRALGFESPAAAIGRQLRQPPNLTPGPNGQVIQPSLTVAGVIRDYNYSNLQERIEPIVIAQTEDLVAYRYMNLRLSTRDFPNAVENIKKKWKELLPEAPFEYAFMDDNFQALYRSETQLRKATNIATVLNLIVVFMGIFGVVAFTLTKRSKEIAMRKVLGADVKSILSLFVKEYLWLIVIASAIAWPLAYMISNKWLENYAYKIDQTVWPYLAVFAFILATTVVLISAQCIKAAVVSPVKSLRAE